MKSHTRGYLLEITVGVLLIILMTCDVRADESVDWAHFKLPAPQLVVSGFSFHPGVDGMREVNPGVGVYLPLNDRRALIAGTYINSYDKRTTYAGMSFHALGDGFLQLRVDAVLATGYQSAVIAGVIPVVELATGPIVTRLLLIPKVSADTATAYGLQWRINFN